MTRADCEPAKWTTVLLGLVLLACGGEATTPPAAGSASSLAATVWLKAPSPHRLPLIDASRLVRTPRARLLRDEVIALGAQVYDTPSLAVDHQGVPHVAVITADAAKPGLKQLNSVHWASRAGGRWSLARGVARSYRAVAHTTPAGALQLWTWDASSNRTEMRQLGASGFSVIDAVDLVQAYQPLYRGGALQALLGDFGGNLYLVTRAAGSWRKTWVRRHGSDVRPPGVLVGARAAIFERTQLTYIGAGSESVPGPKPGYRRPSPPRVAPDGTVWVLQDTAARWQNRILLQHRDTAGRWHTQVAHVDAAPPPSSTCPTQLGQPCTFTTVSHQPQGLALANNRPVAVLLRVTQQARYQRTCLQRDPNYPGSTPPCIDPGGPSGPWGSQPIKGAVTKVELVVDGLAVATLGGQHTSPMRLVVASDALGRVHVATYQKSPSGPRHSDLRVLLVRP